MTPSPSRSLRGLPVSDTDEWPKDQNRETAITLDAAQGIKPSESHRLHYTDEDLDFYLSIVAEMHANPGAIVDVRE